MGRSGPDVAYVVPVTAEEAMERLRAAIDAPEPAAWLIPGAYHGRRFVGRVGGHTFEVWVRRQSYNSLAPRAVGRVTARDRGSLVEASIRPPRLATVGPPILLLIAALGGTPVLWSVGYGPIALLIGGVLALVAALLLRRPARHGFPRSEERELRGLLDELFSD